MQTILTSPTAVLNTNCSLFESDRILDRRDCVKVQLEGVEIILVARFWSLKLDEHLRYMPLDPHFKQLGKYFTAFAALGCDYFLWIFITDSSHRHCHGCWKQHQSSYRHWTGQLCLCAHPLWLWYSRKLLRELSLIVNKLGQMRRIWAVTLSNQQKAFHQLPSRYRDPMQQWRRNQGGLPFKKGHTLWHVITFTFGVAFFLLSGNPVFFCAIYCWLTITA